MTRDWTRTLKRREGDGTTLVSPPPLLLRRVVAVWSLHSRSSLSLQAASGAFLLFDLLHSRAASGATAFSRRTLLLAHAAVALAIAGAWIAAPPGRATVTQ